MLFLKSWLEDYINLSDFSPAQLAEIITKKSSEVEEIVEVTERFAGKVVVGKIQSLRKHPEADKLNIFDVNIGEKGLIQIVSAATNARDGLIIPVALDGAKLAGFTIQAKKLRGFESQGMCCGMSELLLETEYSSGLWELNSLLEDEVFLGWSICEALPEYFPTEHVMDIKVLPDKIGVIGNHLGMALEIALILEQPELLTSLALSLTQKDQIVESIKQLSERLEHGSINNFPVVFKDETSYTNSFNLLSFELNKPFSLNHIYQQRMNLTGRNLVGGLVDLSNYILFDIGQPNHIFSLPKLEKIIQSADQPNSLENLEHRAEISSESKPESILEDKVESNLENTPKVDLDGVLESELSDISGSKTEVNLVEKKLVVWNIEKLESTETFEGLGQLKSTNLPFNLTVLKQENETLHIPGISGGDSTKVDIDETRFMVEIASFKPEQVGRNSFALNYRSDGSKIWAGGVNPARVLVGILRLFSLLEDKASHSNLTLSWLIQLGALPNLQILANQIFDIESNLVDINLDYIIERLDGRDKNYWQDIVLSKLNQLGSFENNQLVLNSFYNRIRTQEDVLAEIVRLVSFENLQTHYLDFSTVPNITPDFDKKQDWKKAMVNFGFYETITRPFLAESELLLSIKGSKNGQKDNQKNSQNQIQNQNLTQNQVQPFQILNPYSSLQPFFRDSLLPSLLESAAKNIKRGEKEINLFEASQVYTLIGGHKQENYEIWAVSVGEEITRITSFVHHASSALAANISFKNLTKDNWEAAGLGVEYSIYQNVDLNRGSENAYADSVNNSGDSLESQLDLNRDQDNNTNQEEQTIDEKQTNLSRNILNKIVVLEINKKLKKQFGLPLTKSVWAMRISFENGISALSHYPKYLEESDYPGISRNYSLVIPNTLNWNNVAEIIGAASSGDVQIQLIPTERIVDGLENLDGFVILNFQANLQSYEKTLEGEAVDLWEKTWQEKLLNQFKEIKVR